MNKAAIITIVALVIIGGLWWAYRGTAPATVTEPVATTTVNTTIINSTTTVVTSPVVKEFTVTGSNFKFDTPTITVNQGDTVRLTFKSIGGTHNFVIDEFNAKTNILSGGQQQTIEFVASKTGSFEYYCSVGNHRAMGMKGMLIVK